MSVCVFGNDFGEIWVNCETRWRNGERERERENNFSFAPRLAEWSLVAGHSAPAPLVSRLVLREKKLFLGSPAQRQLRNGWLREKHDDEFGGDEIGMNRTGGRQDGIESMILKTPTIRQLFVLPSHLLSLLTLTTTFFSPHCACELREQKLPAYLFAARWPIQRQLQFNHISLVFGHNVSRELTKLPAHRSSNLALEEPLLLKLASSLQINFNHHQRQCNKLTSQLLTQPKKASRSRVINLIQISDSPERSRTNKNCFSLPKLFPFM